MENNTNIAPVNRFYQVCGIIISLCAIAEFIIWIVDANRVHASNLVVMGIGLLAISAAVLFYLIVRPKARVAANTGLWTGIIASIVLLFIGIAMS